MKRITLAHVIDWAKDRLADDLVDYVDSEVNDPKTVKGERVAGFSWLPKKERRLLCERLAKGARLLSLPVSLDSLLQLSKAGYWNIHGDTLWESIDEPAWYKKWAKGYPETNR